jgi:rhamnose utilization protein RhaD (predicted bifunctional aldolase and dehydrogenase)/NAD(P)-dependent dehydrogenase (short-subunit alcohol dehydrogenase family)
MENRWADQTTDPLDACVHGSRLLGAEPDLVLHGGGNTSVKVTVDDVTGKPVEVLYVKGSGWDLASIERAGFAPLRLERLRELLTVDDLPDSAMMNELRCALLDAGAPDPSVETLLHALLPHKAVLHSHADAVITLSNLDQPLVRKVFGDSVVVVPYVMPGFRLARTAAELFPRHANENTVGMVLMNHGLFTFGEDVKEAYDRHIELVTKAEAYLGEYVPTTLPALEVPALVLAKLRNRISAAAGVPVVMRRTIEPAVMSFVARKDLADVAGRGPATPDHVIRTKRVPMVGRDVNDYADSYRSYFAKHSTPGLTTLDPAPRVVLDPELGMLTAGRRATDADIARDIYLHTIKIIEQAEAVGTYRALPAKDLFDVEYWELEQAKLKRAGEPPEFAGEVALVTGAASGIGKACADALRVRGASVIGIDLNPSDNARRDSPDYLGIRANVADPEALATAIHRGVERFGGVDIVVPSAGIFPPSLPLGQLDSTAWRYTMAVNTDAVAELFSQVHPLLKLSPKGGRVVVIGSKNVPAPGPGVAAYSASKAAVTQLARVAALEWAKDRIRVNTVHPDAVFDTGIWTRELLEQRADHYGLTVDQYKRRNLLGVEITSATVGRLVAELCSSTFACTTGAQVPVDGGNERVV